ncbi:MAG TPA: metal ABC transporter permease [Smithellaceae bacterium]|jgi:zinc transport system permease protein|nr:metal ABC transporter permease [Syntrophaceae bacterium]OQC74067.1 MAG: High-affinity zinc uptake system membrane protein ZnuB [Deltaproteobacteria bacterium ADurb.Bin002]HNV56616.1 metal ABC transporter permease [Smithellaceae bacterium]MBP8666094.1 metal ABC transporter permease [Syntrophaceae bacterium]MBP9531917.1 metal ABC transporter permease [Syntrophaceae bacterium]
MDLGEIFAYAFVQRAMLAGALIAAVSALLGLFLVLRRFSLIGDGLAHTTFGSVAVVLLVGVSPFYVTLAALPLVMVSSLAIYKLTSSKKINADAAIGIVSSLGIAAGITLSSLSGGFNVDLFSYLFGNILTVNRTELVLSMIVFAVVAAVVFYYYDDLFAVTFDQELARSMGVQTERLNVILFLLTAVSAVLAMKVAGIMLVSALLILPALTALQLSVGFRTTMIAATGFAVGAVFCGILFAFVLNLPAGAMIVVFNAVFLLLVFGIRRLFAGHG